MENQQAETGEGSMEQPAGQDEKINGERIKEVATDRDLYMSSSLALTAQAGNDMQVSESVAGILAAGGDMQFTNSFGNALVAGGDIELTDSGSGVLVAGKSGIVNHGTVGMIISQQTILGEGSQVLLDTPQAIAFGAAIGAMFGLVCWLLTKRK